MLLVATSFIMSCGGNQNANQAVESDSTDVVANADSSETTKADSIAAAEEAAKAEQAQQDADAEVIKKFLSSIYTPKGLNNIFEDTWVRKHCTPRMQKILRDAYDYEGVGWGSWLIGGWGDGEDIETKMTGITYDGQYFYANLEPTGYSKQYAKGKRVIRFEVSLVDGTPVINDCDWTKDFKY